jgi:hypothetical protein
MNWMIDGLYGELYRAAMGYRPLTPCKEPGSCHPSDRSPDRAPCLPDHSLNRPYGEVMLRKAVGLPQIAQDCVKRKDALARAESSGEFGGSWLSCLLRNWKARRCIAQLESLDDSLLKDIDLTREDVRWATALPLSVNAELALRDRVFRRRKNLPATFGSS